MSVLSDHLDRLLQWLGSIELQPPSRDIRIVKITYPETDQVPGTNQLLLVEPSAYENRFAELLEAGYSWLNIECWGVYNGS